MGVRANKTKDYSAEESFAKNFGNTPAHCESIGTEQDYCFNSYAELEKEPVLIHFKK